MTMQRMLATHNAENADLAIAAGRRNHAQINLAVQKVAQLHEGRAGPVYAEYSSIMMTL